MFLLLGGIPWAAWAQADGVRGSRNIEVVSHLPLGGMRPASGAESAGFEGLGRRTGDIEVEQDIARPYAYVARRYGPPGFDLIDLTDPARPRLLFSWAVDGPADGQGLEAEDVKYLKLAGRYYLALALQGASGSTDAALGAILFDVTGLPDPSTVREVARIQGIPGGFTSLFPYKHADGRVLLFAVGGASAVVYDMERLLAGPTGSDPIGRIDPPDQLGDAPAGYTDAFVGYHPDSGQDRFYGAGTGGYAVYDVSTPEAPALLTQISSAAVRVGHAIAPTPEGRYLVTAAGYRTSPLRIFDVQPALEGQVPQVRTAIGAWTSDWKNFANGFEVRWPFVFVAALDDGLQVFNLRDPYAPYTVAYYYTWDGPPGTVGESQTDLNGAWEVDVRNADGLIVVSDLNTGFWAFRMEAFEGWHGHGWGLPNMSSVQDWDQGPDGAY